MGETRFDTSVQNRLRTPGIITGKESLGERPVNPGGTGYIFIDNETEEIYTYLVETGWILIGSGGAGASSGSGITVVGTNVNLGRDATALTVDANLVTTGGFKIYINPDADGALLDFDQTNNNTYVNGGRGNTGTNSCFLGKGSGRNNTGLSVSAFGYRALSGNTGNSTTAFGNAAGDTQSGSTCCFFGRLAGDHNTASNLNAFGFSAGQNNTGNNVIAIGSLAGVANSFNAAIMIGDNAAATANNQLVLSFNKMARFAFNGLTANRAYTMQDVDGVIALLKDGNGITASATGFDLGGALTANVNLSLNGSELLIQGVGSGIRFTPGTQLTDIGDTGGSGSGSLFSVDDANQKLSITGNLSVAPGAVAITTDFIKILVGGVDYFIPLYQ